MKIASIVEGHAEVNSVRVLLNRLLFDYLYEQIELDQIAIAEPWREPRDRIVKPDELEKAIEAVQLNRDEVHGMIILIDADDDCPAELGEGLQKRAQDFAHIPVEVVLPNHNFESWFLGSKESLAGKCYIHPDASNYEDPESISGTKSHLTENMRDNRRYKSTLDQPSLTNRFDLEMARENCSSFDKMIRSVKSILTRIT